jgi:hypothetical protein
MTKHLPPELRKEYEAEHPTDGQPCCDDNVKAKKKE